MSSALRRVRWIPVLVVSLLALGGGAAIGFALGAGDPAPVVREPLAQTSKARGAPERTLALTRITIQPGTRLALHHHPGTQIAYVDRGVLTYTVEQGSARVKRGPADDHPVLVRKLEAGDTARLKPGSGSSSSRATTITPPTRAIARSSSTSRRCSRRARRPRFPAETGEGRRHGARPGGSRAGSGLASGQTGRRVSLSSSPNSTIPAST